MNASRFSVLALALLAAPGLFISSAAFAQDPCAPNGSLMQGAIQVQRERAQEIEEHARNIYGPMAQSPEWLSDANSLLANCVADQYGDWSVSTGSALFDNIANKAKDAAIDRACAEQRRRVAEYTSEATGYLSRVEGYQDIGSRVIDFPDGSGGIDYDDLIDDIGGGQVPQIPQVPRIPGVGGPGGVPGVGGPNPPAQPPRQPPGGGGVPGIIP